MVCCSFKWLKNHFLQKERVASKSEGVVSWPCRKKMICVGKTMRNETKRTENFFFFLSKPKGKI